MQTLTIEPTYTYAVAPGRTDIVLVGCGGTGSFVAQSLARLMSAHPDAIGDVTFFDGDRVEHKNVGRQLFAPRDIGHNKAEVLAARLNAAYGLRIVAAPMFLTSDLLSQPSNRQLIIGAVDTGEARCEIDGYGETVHWRSDLWLDIGNHDTSGQVAVGAVRCRSGRDMKGSLHNHLCSKLPSPALQLPDLLNDPEPEPTADPANCADAIAAGAQSLMINQMMAAIASQYLYAILVERKLTTYQTTVDCRSLTMRSEPITAASLARTLGCTAAFLQGA